MARGVQLHKYGIRQRRTVPGRPFEKGHKRMGGRKKGTKNIVTREIKAFLIAMTKSPQYQGNVKRRIMDGKAPTVELLALHWAGGKPAETHEVSVGTLDHLYALAASKGLGERTEGVGDVGEDGEGTDGS